MDYDVFESQAERAAFEAEMFYFDTIDRIADLIVSYGRDRVMTDVTELVIQKVNEISIAEKTSEQLGELK